MRGLTPKIPVATAEEAKRRGTTVHPSAVDSPVPILAAATTQRAVRAPVGALSPRMGTWLRRKARGDRRLVWSARAWGVPCSALLCPESYLFCSERRVTRHGLRATSSELDR